jgi:2-phospho-L-lactate guanylyltransferase (CobY/MobA/RfbA family)
MMVIIGVRHVKRNLKGRMSSALSAMTPLQFVLVNLKLIASVVARINANVITIIT